MASELSAPLPRLQVEKVGKLHKRGQKRKNWLERTFVLKQGALCYFDGKTCKGVIPTKTMTGAKTVDDSWGSKSDKKMPCRFSLNTTERTYYFSAATWKDMESWIRAFESWIGVDNGVTRQRAATADMDDGADGPVVHKCQACGKTYQTIEDLSTHIVLRHPGEPVPLPAGSAGIASRKVCTTCGKWYELERDLELHIQKRHSGDAGLARQASNPLGMSGGPAAPAADGQPATAVSAFDLPDVAGFSTVEAKACRICKRFFENEAKLAEHTAQEHGVDTNADDSQYGKLSLVPKSSDAPAAPVSEAAAAAKQADDDWGEIGDILDDMEDLDNL